MSDDEAEMARLRKKRGFGSSFNPTELPLEQEEVDLSAFVGQSYLNKINHRQSK